MAYKPLPILTAKKLLYFIKTMNEALTLNSPRTLSEAKLLLATFEVITTEAIKEAEDELGPEVAAVA